MAEMMGLQQVRDAMKAKLSGGYRAGSFDMQDWLAALDAHLTQPAQAVDVGLVERLRKRAGEERTIAANNARVAELLAPELALFEAKEGHNIYATRMAIDHRDSAKRDAAFADDLEAAATALTRALGNAQAEGWKVPDDDTLLEIARDCGLRCHLHGVAAPNAKRLLRAFVDALPTPPQPEE